MGLAILAALSSQYAPGNGRLSIVEAAAGDAIFSGFQRLPLAELGFDVEDEGTTASASISAASLESKR